MVAQSGGSTFSQIGGLNAVNSKFAGSQGITGSGFSDTGFDALSSDAQNSVYDWGRTGDFNNNADATEWYTGLTEDQQNQMVAGQKDWAADWDKQYNTAQSNGADGTVGFEQNVPPGGYGNGKSSGGGGYSGGKGGQSAGQGTAGGKGGYGGGKGSGEPNTGQYQGLPNANVGAMSDAANAANYKKTNAPVAGGLGNPSPYNGTTPPPPPVQPTAQTQPVAPPMVAPPPQTAAPVAEVAPTPAAPQQEMDQFQRISHMGGDGDNISASYGEIMNDPRLRSKFRGATYFDAQGNRKYI